jgi:hypothetical protein
MCGRVGANSEGMWWRDEGKKRRLISDSKSLLGARHVRLFVGDEMSCGIFL